MAKYKGSKSSKQKKTTAPNKRVAKKKSRKTASNSFFSGNNKIWLLGGISVLLTFICFASVLSADFVNFDDDVLILQNSVLLKGNLSEMLRFQLFSAHYKPIVYFTWFIEHRLFGFDSFVFHLDNLILHLINTVLVLIVSLKIARFWPLTQKYAWEFAFFSAILFGIHPLHVESVAWAIERKDVLFGMFYLMGMFGYLKFLESETQKYWIYISALCYLLCILSKSMGITLIAVVGLLDLAMNRKIALPLFIEKIPFALIFLLSIYLFGFFNGKVTKDLSSKRPETLIESSEAGDKTITGQKNKNNGIAKDLASRNYRLLFYVYHTLVPINLAAIYSYNEHTSMIGGGIYALFFITFGLAFLGFWYRKKVPILWFSMLFYLITISPALAIGVEGTNFLSDRYVYIPSIGIMFFVLYGMFWLIEKYLANKANMTWIIPGALSLVFAIACFNRVPVWKNSLSLWNDQIKKSGENAYESKAYALNGRSRYYSANNDATKALADLNEALRLAPEYYEALLNRGILYNQLGKYKEALIDHQMTIDLYPDDIQGYVNKGETYISLEQYNKSIDILTKGIALRAHMRKGHKAYNNRGVAYLRLGQTQKAIADFQEAARILPIYDKAYLNLASAYSRTNNAEEAIKNASIYLQFDPNNHAVYHLKGRMHLVQKNTQAALQDINTAIKLNPNSWQYYTSRALVYNAMGQTAKAQADEQRSNQLRQ